MIERAKRERAGEGGFHERDRAAILAHVGWTEHDRCRVRVAGGDRGGALRQGEWLPGMSETHLATSSNEALDSINQSHILNSRCVVVPSLFYRICSSIRQ